MEDQELLRAHDSLPEEVEVLAGLRPITTTTPYVWTRAGTVGDG